MNDQRHVVVRNHEDQYAVWPQAKPLPAGWQECGFQGQKAECLAWIDTHWIDMTPASVRRALNGARG